VDLKTGGATGPLLLRALIYLYFFGSSFEPMMRIANELQLSNLGLVLKTLAVTGALINDTNLGER